MKHLMTFVSIYLMASQSFLFAQPDTKEGRIYWLSKMWKDVSDNFYDTPKLEAINWDSLYISYIPQVESTEKRCDYYGLLSRFMASLHDGHSGFYSRESCDNESSSYDILPFEIVEANDKFYISSVWKGLAESIPLGSELLEVEKQSTFDYLNQFHAPFTNGNTPQTRLKLALSKFIGGIENGSIIIKIKTPQGEIRENKVEFKYGEYREDFLSILPEKRKGTDIFLKQDINDIPYFYIRFDSFGIKTISNTLNMITDKVKQADYLVLDLRNNPGGSELIADSLLMCFLDIDTLKTYKSITRINNAYKAAMGYGYKEYKEYYENTVLDTLSESIRVKENLPLFNQPLFILINNETYSAAEDLLITLKLHYPDRAIIVGTPTGASTGAPLVRLLSPGVYYRICTRGALLPQGLFENGIQPTYYYSSSWEEMVSGEDHIFEFIGEIYNKNNKNESK
ncbi:MAG: PDZ domain-containing protein [Candidatus Symbiothrix sp.]|jgi:C-terminal processing protease CtpA/Prc|nr:PDZ domain-containing protein [Candidatus Symbiothrix sp.]